MGGIWKLVPVTYVLMWIGSLALAGIWPFAGYFSKDFVLEAAYSAGTWYGTLGYWLGLFAALLTAFYSWRLLILTFHGKPRADETVMARVHESPKVMLLPMTVLGIGAVCAGFLGYQSFVGHGMTAFWRGAIETLPSHPAIEAAHHAPFWVGTAPMVFGAIGIALAVIAYVVAPDLPRLLASRLSGLYQFLLNKWYFDELYDFLFVRPAFIIGRGLWKGGDGAVIDGVGPDGVAATALRIARGATRLQTGYIFHYAFAMLIGLVVLISWYLLRIAA
jgi:NADH-quinone oxidoreductase subunit L